MPIIEIEVITPDGAVPRATMASELANRLGEVFGTPAGQTWVRLRTTSSSHYAENDAPVENDMLPVFVTVLKAGQPGRASMADESARIASAIADVCDVTRERVHVLYQPDAAGRIAFGGRLDTA